MMQGRKNIKSYTALERSYLSPFTLTAHYKCIIILTYIIYKEELNFSAANYHVIIFEDFNKLDQQDQNTFHHR
jgi:hypothetical protein